MELTAYCAYPKYQEEEELKIEFQYNSNISDILQTIKERKDVKFLKLFFNQYYLYSNEEIKDQSHYDKELEEISCLMSQSIKLETLFIKFEENYRLKSQQMKILVNSLIKLGPQLIHLDFFIFEGNQILLDGAKYLAQGISHCSNLKTLRIKIKDKNRITKDGAIVLGEAIGNCVCLQELLIYIEGEDHNIGQDGAKGLSDGIKNLINLKKLAIRIWWSNQLGPEGAFYLTNYLPFLTNLISLYLEFGTDNQYTYQGAVHISNGLKSCKNLEDLTFVMWANSGIGGDGFKIICKSFQELTNLKQFKVLFYGDSNFDTDSLTHLRNIFQHLQKLEHIIIELNPIQIELQGSTLLIKVLEKINNLYTFSFRYSNEFNNNNISLNKYILRKFKRLIILQ